MMKLLFCFIASNICLWAGAQEHLEGNWYSPDSTRIYKIYKKADGYEAILLQSKRKDDRPGALVLSNIFCNKKKNQYNGFIHAVNDGLATTVKITKTDDGKTLKLTLRRMFIFPVNMQWHKINEGSVIRTGI